MTEWTETDQAYADFVSEVACEASAREDDVYAVLGALEERGLFSISEAAALILQGDGSSQDEAPHCATALPRPYPLKRRVSEAEERLKAERALRMRSAFQKLRTDWILLRDAINVLGWRRVAVLAWQVYGPRKADGDA